MTQKELEDLLEAVLVIGKLMIQSGAEVKRVEDTIRRICKAYGIKRTEVYVLNRLIIATVKTEDGITATQSITIMHMSNNLGALEALNSLSRRICADPPEIHQLHEMTEETIVASSTGYHNCIGYILAF